MSELVTSNYAAELYCRAYVKTLNRAEALRISGFTGNPNLASIKKRCRQLFSDIYERLDVVPSRTVAEVARIAFFDPATCFDKDGTLLQVKDMPASTRACIKEIEEKEYRDKITGAVVRKTTKLKIHSKIDALEMLAKTQGLLQSAAAQRDKPNAGDNEKVTFNLIMGKGEQLTISKPKADEAIEVVGERIDSGLHSQS
jgi:hypothetical protein